MVHMLVFLAKKPFKPVKQLDSVIVLVSVFLKGIVQSGLFFFFFGGLITHISYIFCLVSVLET